MSIVDAHVHLWDPDRLHYAWLRGTPLNHLVDATALVPAAGPGTDVVVVQADCAESEGLAEAQWLTTQAADFPRLRGVVAYAPLHLGAGARPALEALAELPAVVGVRRLIQDESPGFALTPAFLAGVALLPGFAFTFDICVRATQLGEAVELVRRRPEVSFVLDHLGKPPVGADDTPWRRQLESLAALGNVVVKLSGLMTERVPGAGAEAVPPYLAYALALFGADRCLFGSDWPVMTEATTYSAWRELVLTVVPEPDRALVLGGTAERVYGLPPAP